jgi:hypothetical protein
MISTAVISYFADGFFFLESKEKRDMGSGGNKVMADKPTDTRTQAAIAGTNTPTLLEQVGNQSLTNWQPWINPTGQKQDIMTAPGMDVSGDIYGNAASLAAQQRVGDPTHAFTANLPGFNNQLQQQKAMNMYNTRAAGLSNAFQTAKAQALGLGQESAQEQINRQNMYGQLQNAYGTSYYNRPQQVPLWKQIAGLAMGGLSAVGGGTGLKALGV